MTRPHFLGTDASESPLVPHLLTAAKSLTKLDAQDGVVSARYGPRFVVNGANVPLGMLGPAHFVEVADYDPTTDQLLCLGAHAPHAVAPLHALVYRAKKEVNALAQVTLPKDHAALGGELPRVERQARNLDTAMRMLETLRDADALVLGEQDVVATGTTPERAAERVRDLVEGA